MNENFDIKEYLSKLPKPIQDFVSSGNWESRVYEISKKYSLNTTQSEDLSNIVLLTLTLISNPDDIKQTIVEDLGISDLLASQIVEDLESRVFDFILKQIEPKEEVVVRQPPNQINNSIPEIRPKMSPAPINLPTEEMNSPRTAFQNHILDNQKKSEPVVGVPRYAETAIQNSAPKNIIENKLNNVTTGINEKPPVKYEKDPYREALN